LARSVADFVADVNGGNGMLPLMGVVPDMKADSNRYILIQNWSHPSDANLIVVIVASLKQIWGMCLVELRDFF
jgi:hypothetical protein